MLTVHHGNRLETLCDGLRAVLAAPLPDLFAPNPFVPEPFAPNPFVPDAFVPDPFVPETIVVQNAGMARWLAQRLAAADGVAANLAFPLPASFIWQVFRAWLADLPAASPFDREALVWRVYAALPRRLGEPAFAALGRYLTGEPRALKRWQLAGRIADVFDQYLVYRPGLVLGWEAGGDDAGGAEADVAWQATLWRDLLAAGDAGPGEPPLHRARLLARMQAAWDADTPPVAPERLPARLALFGLTALPPAYCRLLQLLARHAEVHLFVLDPCAEYWADIVDEGGRARRRARALAGGAPDPGALLDLGNPLLAAFGHTGQAFLDQVLELDGDSDEAFVEPVGDGLLARLQRDVLRLRDPRRARLAERAPLADGDDSLLVHRCHGPLREVQVLHDRLLALIEATAAAGTPLEPRDILVMAPDIDVYAPFIDAVFGAAPPARALPWSIADRRHRAEAPLLVALAELLALPQSRLTAAEVLGWLQVPAIARRCGLDDAALARIRTWAAETGIRWGLDAGMRAALDLPAEGANTWAFGLERLFLGLALPVPGFDGPAATVAPADADGREPSATRLFAGRLPYADLDGGDAAALGALQTALDRLRHWRAALGRAQPAASWRAALLGLLADLFDPDDDEEALLAPVREAADALARHAAAAGLDEALPPDLIRDLIGGVIDGGGGAQRFLTGRVTFCNMVPMRSIPARVIALLGLEGSAFPRRQRPVGFDLIARHPLRGDRSRRADDRYLFLEALLSAREHLHLSYSGRDPRDNAPRVPSVVLDELLAVIDQGYRLPGAPVETGTDDEAADAAADADRLRPSARLVIDHPLQPFSPRAFDPADPRRWSFAAEWAGVGAAPGGLVGLVGAGPPFAVPLPVAVLTTGMAGVDPDAPVAIEVADLAAFLRHPARWYLRQRLRLRLPGEALAPEDAEPFALDGLARWSVRQRLLAVGAAGATPDLSPAAFDEPGGLALLRAEGLLPHGASGALVWAEQAARVERFRAEWARHRSPVRPRREVDLTLALPGGAPGGGPDDAERSVRLVGWLDDLTEDGVQSARLGTCRAADLLALWLRHLLLNALAPSDCARRSALLSDETDDGPTWTRLRPVVDPRPVLVTLVRLWLEARRAPPPLYPQSSLVFARTGDLAKARKVWEDQYQGPPGEGSDAAVALVTRGQPAPLGAPFQALALALFEPLLAAIDDGD